MPTTLDSPYVRLTSANRRAAEAQAVLSILDAEAARHDHRATLLAGLLHTPTADLVAADVEGLVSLVRQTVVQVEEIRAISASASDVQAVVNAAYEIDVIVRRARINVGRVEALVAALEEQVDVNYASIEG